MGLFGSSIKLAPMIVYAIISCVLKSFTNIFSFFIAGLSDKLSLLSFSENLQSWCLFHEIRPGIPEFCPKYSKNSLCFLLLLPSLKVFRIS